MIDKNNPFEVTRTKSGVFGLDELIGGGIPSGRNVLLTGAAGSGKTIFGMQYIYYGIKEFSEPGIFVTMDERPFYLKEEMKTFGWDLQRLIDEGMLVLIDGSDAKIDMGTENDYYEVPIRGFDIDKLILEILRQAKRINAKRIVIDSGTMMALRMISEEEQKIAFAKIMQAMVRIDATTLIVSETNLGHNDYSRFGIEEHICDGIFALSIDSDIHAGTRNIHIRKLRATKHSEKKHKMEITQNGIRIYN